jgi:hypothetical protein
LHGRAYHLRLALAACALVAAGAARAAEPPLGSTLYVPSDIYAAAGGATVDRAAAERAFYRARQAIAAKDPSAALRAACEALAADPDHAEARRLLGYQRVGEAWAGGFAARMIDGGHVWRPEFGWIKAEHLPRFEQGLRPWGSRWISIDEDAARHATIARGWTVRTDHFVITTNVDRAAGVELAMRLETLYQLWRQLFAEFTTSAAELEARLAGKETTGFLRKPFRVVYHRSRDEYNAALVSLQPQIAMTLGIYFDRTRESHFFAGADQDPGTIAHEAVHQFFYESAAKPTRQLAGAANVWAVEGVACYFESLAEVEGAAPRRFTIGRPGAGRLPAARHRRIVDQYYVPLEELSALGMIELQARQDIARLYSQSAGLAAFFIDGREGRYRRPFGELLALVYAGRDAPDKLAELTGRSYAELDGEYLEFMRSLPIETAAE